MGAFFQNKNFSQKILNFIFAHQVIARARNHHQACAKLIRALKEFRIRGVKTNMPFLINVLEQPEFRTGVVDTYFIDEHPELFAFKASQNRAQKLL